MSAHKSVMAQPRLRAFSHRHWLLGRPLSVSLSFSIRDRQYGNAAFGVGREAGGRPPVGAIDELASQLKLLIESHGPQ